MKKTTLLLQTTSAVSLTWLATTAISAAADFLMIPDSVSDRILLFDPENGALVNGNFIDGTGLFETPLNAIQVNQEIWVSDQVADSIFRFDLTGGLLGAIAGGLDNIRGMALIEGTVYVANSGTDNGAPGGAIVKFDPQGNNLGFFAVGDPYDVFFYNGELLVNDINSESEGGEDIDRYDLSGNLLGTFHESNGETGIDFPQQMARRGNGNLLVAGFSAPAGIYEYDPSGNQIALYDGNNGIAFRGIRGVYELGNGNILWTGGDGVVSTNLATGIATDIYTVNTPDLLPPGVSRPGARYIEKLSIPEPEPVPEPSAIVGWATVGLVMRLLRRQPTEV